MYSKNQMRYHYHDKYAKPPANSEIYKFYVSLLDKFIMFLLILHIVNT